MRYTIKAVRPSSPLKNIVRRDTTWHGWEYNKSINNQLFRKFFADSDYDSPAAALEEALQYKLSHEKDVQIVMVDYPTAAKTPAPNYSRKSKYQSLFEGGNFFYVKQSQVSGVYRAARRTGIRVSIWQERPVSSPGIYTVEIL